MLDQSFSYDTISTVFMQSNRKGQVKKEFLSAEYLEAAKEYRSMRHTINTNYINGYFYIASKSAVYN